MIEHFFQCPYCWQEISMLLDKSVLSQTYIEDCEVCCNPIQITIAFENSELISFYTESLEQ
jgi:transcription elongation factor Elf1